MSFNVTRNVTRRRLLATGAAAAALPIVGAPAIAQSWRPSKPIRIVVGYPAGGSTDLLARAFGEYISRHLGQPVVIDNKAGAGGTVAAVDVKRSAPDGHTLMYTISTTMIMNKVLYKNLPYDPDKDFALISYTPVAGLPLVVSAGTGLTNFKDFVAFARKNKTNVGTYGAGSFAHMGIAEVNKFYGLNIEPVHYRGEAPMWTDLASGSIHGAIGGSTPAENVIVAGKGKAVAVLAKKRLKKMPDVPTFLEHGANSKGFGLMGYTCMVGPAGMPDDIVEQYSRLVVAAGQDEEVWKKLDAIGVEDPPRSRAEFQKIQTEEAPIWLELASGLGLTPE